MNRCIRVLGVLLLMAVFMVTVDASTAHEPAGSTTQLAQTTGADFSVTKSDSLDPVSRGQKIPYTIILNNAGPDNGVNVVLTDTLPPGTTLAGGVAPTGWTCVAPPGQVRCSKADVPPGNYTFTFNAAVPLSYAGPEPLVNNVNVTAANDPNPTNNTDSEITSFAVPLSATATCINNDSDLQVSITAGNGPFDITGGGAGLPVLGVGAGSYTFVGPNQWNVVVSETQGDLETINFGTIKCKGNVTPIPISPTNNSTISDQTPTFTWTAVTDATSYKLILVDNAKAPLRTLEILHFTPNTSATLAQVLPPGQYYWRVAARIGYVYTPWSPVSTFTIDTGVPLTFAPPNTGAEWDTSLDFDVSTGAEVSVAPTIPTVAFPQDGAVVVPPQSNPAATEGTTLPGADGSAPPAPPNSR